MMTCKEEIDCCQACCDEARVPHTLRFLAFVCTCVIHEIVEDVDATSTAQVGDDSRKQRMFFMCLCHLRERTQILYMT